MRATSGAIDDRSQMPHVMIAIGSEGEEEPVKPRCLIIRVALLALAIVAASRPVEALELSGGVSWGGILAGTVPRFAVSPHAGVSWRTESGFLFEARNLCSILLASNKDGVGIYDQTSATIGYASKKSSFSAGPSFSIYNMPACGATLCGRLAGLAPGGRAQASVYFADPLGVALQANVDWMGGRSRVLSGGVAAMVVAGPVLRWRSP